METSEFLSTVETLHGDARRRGLFFQHCTDDELRGRTITVDGQELLSFGSCSYLGLEYHPALIRGVHEAVDRYGTQFASSRGYLSAPHYEEFEDYLSQIFGMPSLCVQTTTLAHQAAFDVFLTERDAIVLDHQVHYSVQRAATLARAAGAHVEIVRHEELEKAIDVVARLARKHRTVWFATDGITSMYGELAPIGLLQQILDVAPNVRLYIDDAHGMTWTGERGRGSILSRMPPTDRMVVATSLAKAFAAGGAVLMFPTEAERERVRMCGGPMVFSGPLQPPLLGAALASARLHLTPELTRLQEELAAKVAYCNRRLVEAALPLLVENEVPIMFLRCGLPRVAGELAQRMAKSGVYVNVSMYPAVPMKRGGVRIGITATHTYEQLDRMVAAAAEHLPAVLADEGVSRAELDDLFRGTAARQHLEPRGERTLVAFTRERARASGQSASTPAAHHAADVASGLRVEHLRTIREVPRELWDAALGGQGCCSWDAMATAEQVFKGQPRKEHNWDFHYLLVRDADDRLVAATFLTTSIQKDDALMREEVSRTVEEKRRHDPYFLSSLITTAGSGLSEGNHLYVDRSGPWRGALMCLIEAGSRITDDASAAAFILRDLPGDDVEMDDFLLGEGFIKLMNLRSHRLTLAPGSDDESLLATMSRRTRKFARQILDERPKYRVEASGVGLGAPPSAEVVAQLHELYLNVARRKLRYNAFELPTNLLANLLASPAWEVVTLRLEPEVGGPADGRPIAFWAAHRHGRDYAPLFCGLDYRYVESHGVYRQMLYRMIERARQLGATDLHLGMDAEVEKARWGAVARATCLYVQPRADYNGAVMREVVAELGINHRPGPTSHAAEQRDSR